MSPVREKWNVLDWQSWLGYFNDNPEAANRRRALKLRLAEQGVISGAFGGTLSVDVRCTNQVMHEVLVVADATRRENPEHNMVSAALTPEGQEKIGGHAAGVG
jgi:hypothetical protein